MNVGEALFLPLVPIEKDGYSSDNSGFCKKLGSSKVSGLKELKPVKPVHISEK